MKKALIALFIGLLGLSAWYWFALRPPTKPDIAPPVLMKPTQPVQAEVVEEPDPQPLETQPRVDSPPEPVEEQPPLPDLMDSDSSVLESLSGVVGQAEVQGTVVSDNVVARFVASIDALTGRQVSANLMPIQPPEGGLEANIDFEPAIPLISPEGDPLKQYLMDPVNFARYTHYVDLLESVNSDDLVANFVHYQPLFQQAFLEQGYPEGNFNHRLLEVIDHLLDSPEVEEPVRLIKPEAYYQFADPELESLTAGQKLMIRIGNSNARRAKVKLREIRNSLIAAGVE